VNESFEQHDQRNDQLRESAVREFVRGLGAFRFGDGTVAAMQEMRWAA